MFQKFKNESLEHKQLCIHHVYIVPVVIPLLSESDLDAELHPHVINFLKTPDEEIHPDQAGAVTVWAVVPPVACVHSLTLREFSIYKKKEDLQLIIDMDNKLSLELSRKLISTRLIYNDQNPMIYLNVKVTIFGFESAAQVKILSPNFDWTWVPGWDD